MSEICFRAMRPDDENFILNSWLKSYRSSVPLVGDVVYFREQKYAIRRILLTAEVHIACDPADESVVWAYVVSEGNVVHYAYSKFALRRFGLIRALIERAGLGNHFVCSHLTDAGVKILASHHSSFTFNPWEVHK